MRATRGHMKTLLFTFFLSASAVAEVTPTHVEEMLSQMVRENVISAEEAGKALAKLKNMNSEQWSKINEQAKIAATRSPASALVPSENKITEVNTIDLDGAQFKQIEADMKKILPKN